eukprot:5174880-Pyramimonas_sp.AAC.1
MRPPSARQVLRLNGPVGNPTKHPSGRGRLRLRPSITGHPIHALRRGPIGSGTHDEAHTTVYGWVFRQNEFQLCS